MSSWPITMQWQPEWLEITDDVAVEGAPWTLAKRNGVGALQFSVGLFRSGTIPNPSPEQLLRLLLEFGVTTSLGEPSHIVTEADPLRLAAASYQPNENFIRAWYVSDGKSIAKITYLSRVGSKHDELREAEQMIRTLRFEAGGLHGA